MKRVAVLAGIGACLALVAACGGGGGSNSGFPTSPATTSAAESTGGGSDATTTTSSGSGGGTSLANTDPCSLLSASAAQSLGLPSSGQSQSVGTAQACEWDGSSDVVVVGIRTNGGLSSFPGTSISQIGSHSAMQQSTSGNCIVALGVGSSARVEVSVAGSQVCPVATQVATAIEPKLPSS